MSELEEVREESQELIIPTEQQTLLFYGKPIIVIRLPDGRPAVVLRPFCENMQIDTNGQVKRIRRTEAIADDLVSGIRVERPAEAGLPMIGTESWNRKIAQKSHALINGVPTFFPPVFPAKDSSRRFCLVFSPLSQEKMGFLSHPW